MNFTNAKYVSYLGNNEASIRAELDGKTVCVPLDPATDTTKQSLNG